jgi:hypothetical protein
VLDAYPPSVSLSMITQGFRATNKLAFSQARAQIEAEKTYQRLRQVCNIVTFEVKHFTREAFHKHKIAFLICGWVELQAMYAEEQEAERKERASRNSHKGLT